MREDARRPHRFLAPCRSGLTAGLGLCALCLLESLHGDALIESVAQPRFEALRCVVLIVVFLPTALTTLGPASHARLLTIPELRWLGNISSGTT